MTSYELDKLAKGVAKYLAEEMMNNKELQDTLFPPKIMDICELSTFSTIPIGTLYRKVSEIPHIKVGKRLLFTDRGVIRWLYRNKSKQ